VRKPVWFKVKRLRLNIFLDKRPNPSTKRASLPYPSDDRLLFSKQLVSMWVDNIYPY
jgi:hypothetical protein